MPGLGSCLGLLFRCWPYFTTTQASVTHDLSPRPDLSRRPRYALGYVFHSRNLGKKRSDLVLFLYLTTICNEPYLLTVPFRGTSPHHSRGPRGGDRRMSYNPTWHLPRKQ
ncbi:hypothetical protein EDB92DRAFT_541834 [Lactarius akahatsu]|uniref:Secreted protein n=1 Tax=Lactarius akahatsu TaxID=416441 RepID=A0AAD4QEE6_9AGAM|nr:hypothetical protein EDB92DRAFT_541834 [Lactarius akahatsu]